MCLQKITCHVCHADINVSFVIESSVVVNNVWRMAVVEYFQLPEYLGQNCWLYF